MPYLNLLRWHENASSFTEEERQVLLALSNEKYRWRRRERIVAVTQLEPSAVDKALASLMRKEVVRPTFSSKGNIIYGIRERVG